MSTGVPPFFWKTATGCAPLRNTPLDLCALDEHLGNCQQPNRHAYALHCAAQSVRGFVAARLVTTALVLLGVVGVVAWLL